MKKNLYTRQVENLKRRLGQKWVSRWTENPKGRSRQKLGIKAYDYVLSSCHLPTRRKFCSSTTISTSQVFLSHLRNKGNNELPKKSNCSILQGTKIGSAGEHNQISQFPREWASKSAILSPNKAIQSNLKGSWVSSSRSQHSPAAYMHS